VNQLASLPSVDRLLKHDVLIELISVSGRDQVTDTIRERLSELRQQLSEGAINECPDDNQLAKEIAARVNGQNAASLKRVFNLTGTVIHTNLGRVSLPAAAIQAMNTAAAYPTNLEYDLASGKRGDRDTHIESLLAELTGAEAATVVNNNAAAVMLTLNSLAMGSEVPVSRGELVEIGGSFRIPDIMARSGCHLIEVGTTNRTHLKDFAGAINTNTALIMKVHTSNYEVQGFTKSVDEAELAVLAHEHHLPFVSDLGSGTLIDLTQFGLPHEPTAAETITAGADIVTFSGDKLMGGPQAGLIVGSRELVDRIKSNPMKRALRVDKITLAALYEVLRLYRDPSSLAQKLPGLHLLTRPLTDIQQIATQILPLFESTLGHRYNVSQQSCQSQIGSGSLPLDLLPSVAIAVTAKDGKDQTLVELAQNLRQLPIPVIGRITNGVMLMDLRCMEDISTFCNQLKSLISPQPQND